MDLIALSASIAASAERLDALVSGGGTLAEAREELITVERRFNRFPPQDVPDAIRDDGKKLAFSELWMIARAIKNRAVRLHKLIELGAPTVIIENERRLVAIALRSFPR